jgi:hypothetical protein
MHQAPSVALACLLLLGCGEVTAPDLNKPRQDGSSLSEVIFLIRDQHGTGVSGVGLNVTAPNGTVRSYNTDAVGEARGIMFDGEYRVAISAVPSGYLVPSGQANPHSFTVEKITPYTHVSIRLERS